MAMERWSGRMAPIAFPTLGRGKATKWGKLPLVDLLEKELHLPRNRLRN
jgi:hypothetical protein